MKLTIYKDCIFNKTYDEVAYNQTILDSYLATLSKTEYSNLHIYPKLNDNVIIDWNTLSIFDYNYIKLENETGEDSFKFYAFIDSFLIKNSTCTIYFSCDVWSTFRPYWTMRESLLTRCLYPTIYECSEVNYPVKIISNSPLKVQANDTTRTEQYYLLIEYQTYKLSSADEKEIDRQIRTGIIYNTFTASYILTASEALNTANELIKAQVYKNKYHFSSGGASGDINDLYFNISNLYIVGGDFELPTSLISNTNYFTLYGSESSISSYYRIHLMSEGEVELYTDFIPKRYTLVNYGFLTDKWKIINNGMDINAKFNLYNYGYKFKFAVWLNDEFIEITKDFLLDLPFQTLSAESLEQRKIANELSNEKLTTNTINQSFKIVGGVADIVTGSVKTGVADRMKSRQKKELMGTNAYQDVTNGISNIESGITGIIDNANTRKAINSEQYANTSANIFNNEGFLNQKYGLLVFDYDINSTSFDYKDNYEEVETIIKEIGYEVNHIISAIKTTIPTDKKYDILKFDFIRLVGCSTNVNSILSNILMSGVKIWYNLEV